MDNLTYGYNTTGGVLQNNKLRHVKDAVGNSNYTEDIDNQDDDNYKYDAIGNLIIDKAEGMYDPASPTSAMIEWTVYGKIASITKIKAGVTTTINYTYDASGNRISKTVTTGGTTSSTWYVRDATGNVMGVYDATVPTSGANPIGYTWQEQHLYGSSRLGMFTPRQEIALGTIDGLPGSPVIENAGQRVYELSNHLGNVHVTIANIKREITATPNNYFVPEVLSTTDYYPFGMAMPGRTGYKVTGGWATGNDVVNNAGVPQSIAIDSRNNNTPAEYKASQFIEFLTGFSSGNTDNFVAEIANGSNTTATSSLTANGGMDNVYRYGFNGKENDNDIEEGAQDYGLRIYDPRLGRFLSVDPLTRSYPYYTPYQFAGNTPIANIDLDGAEPKYVAVPNGQGKTKLTFPVVAMIAELNGPSFYRAGAKANFVLDDEVHKRLHTGYTHGAVTLGFEMNFNTSWKNSSDREVLGHIGHEIVHVDQFIARYGSEFNSSKDYAAAVIHWELSYASDSYDAWKDSKETDKESLHDKIPIEADANQKEAVFNDFLKSNDFVRRRKTKDGVKEIADNRVINLLKALDNAKDKNQKERYQANFEALMGLVKKYKEQQAKDAKAAKKSGE
jgi:RHS repeat-associated protein